MRTSKSRRRRGRSSGQWTVVSGRAKLNRSFVTEPSRHHLTYLGSVHAGTESALHLEKDFNRSGRLRRSWWRTDSWSASGSVIRRRRISRPSAVGRTISALRSLYSRASAFMGESGCGVVHSAGRRLGHDSPQRLRSSRICQNKPTPSVVSRKPTSYRSWTEDGGPQSFPAVAPSYCGPYRRCAEAFSSPK